MSNIEIPFNFKPREYQIPFFRAMRGGIKRAVLVDHRRAGKDKTAFNFMVKEAVKRVGVYFYFFPTYNQGRKILWDGIDRDGFRFLNHIPKQLMFGEPNSTEMKIGLVHPEKPGERGSVIQIVGTDNIDSIVGTNPVGCVFSEYALQDPRAWEFVKPILRENGGWAVFPYTPRGKNHGFDLFEMARNNPDWYCERLTVEDTYGKGGTVGKDEIEAERREGMSENMIQQEYYCSFEAAVEYAVFGQQIFKARNEKRIGKFPADNRYPVSTYWDIGRDGTAIWFIQTIRSEVHVVDFYDAYQSNLEADLKEIQKRPYILGTMYMPHDSDHKDYKTGKTPKEIGTNLGFDVQVVPRISKDSQIKAARMMFDRCYFNEDTCARGLDALSSWHYGYDTKMRMMSQNPVHDWSSHAGDAFCQAGVSVEDEVVWQKEDRYSRKKHVNRSWMAA